MVTFSNLKKELLLGSLAANLSGGALIGVMEVFFNISLVSLIFSNQLSTYLPLGIGLGLVSAALTLALTALFSSLPGVQASVQDVPAVLVALMAASLVAQLSGVEVLPTVLALIALTTLLAGLAFILVSLLRAGDLIRYAPFPVIGGFLAATGWLLVQGSLNTMTGLPLNLANLGRFFEPTMLLLWLPGVIIALALFLTARRTNHLLSLPVVLIGSVALFYLALAISGVSMTRANQLGLLLQVDSPIAWQPPGFGVFAAANWQAILSQAGEIAVFLIMVLVSLLLNLSGLELAQEKEFELNPEIRRTGMANLVVGLCGGLVGYHVITNTMLGQRLGARGRLSGMTSALVCLSVLVLGGALISYIPMALVGGVLLFLGFDFLYEWVLTSWRRFTWIEYTIVLLILGLIVITNFLVGVAGGLLAMVVLFVVSYSQINVCRLSSSGAVRRSIVIRSPQQRQKLFKTGGQIHILELEGFIFFGTANKILEIVKSRLDAKDAQPLSYLILDFGRVSGIDSSALLNIQKIEQLSLQQHFLILLTGLSPKIQERFSRGGFNLDEMEFHLFHDLDHGLEWCEEQLLAVADPADKPPPRTATELFVQNGFSQEQAEHLLAYTELRSFQKGDYLWRKFDEAEYLFFIIDGRVSIYAESASGRPVRLSATERGASVGEMGVYLDTLRSAAAIADCETTGVLIKRSELVRMEQEEPQIAVVFHAMIARQLAGWLLQADRSIQALCEDTG